MFGLSVHLSFHLSVRPSVRPSAGVVTLTKSFSIGFLPNNIYGLLASTLIQIQIWIFSDK